MNFIKLNVITNKFKCLLKTTTKREGKLQN
jgi:hypothetical protein